MKELSDLDLLNIFLALCLTVGVLRIIYGLIHQGERDDHRDNWPDLPIS